MQTVKIKDVEIGDKKPLAIICGPCVIENIDHALFCAETLKGIFLQLQIPFIFKSSYDKANRSSRASFRGPGLDEGLRILEKIKRELDLPILTDVHTVAEVTAAAAAVDVIQVPAFLCRQTDLVIAAGHSGAVVTVKKGQFMAPWDMSNVVEKVFSTGNKKLILIDRGTSFGYNNLVSDMRAIPLMQKLGVPVAFDSTHSVQLPGGLGAVSGGMREFIPTLACSAVAAGANSLYIEAHNEPSKAKSDAACVLDFKELPHLLRKLKRIHQATHDEQ